MSPDTPQSNSFESLVHTTFDFLTTEVGFRCVSSDLRLVRYESLIVFVEVGHADHDDEVYVRIGRLDACGIADRLSSERIDFGLFLAVADPGGYRSFHSHFPYSIASKSSDIRKILERFADGVRVKGRGLISGDQKEFDEAHKLRFWHAPDFE